MDKLIDLANRQIAAQLRASQAADTMSVGTLGFGAVLAGLVFATRLRISQMVWVPLLLILVSIVLSVIAIWYGNISYGPAPDEFYFWSGHLSQDEQDPLLLSDLSDTVHGNSLLLARKSLLWVLAAVALMLAVATVIGGYLYGVLI